MKIGKRITHIFILAAFLLASMFSVVYLSKVSTEMNLLETSTVLEVEEATPQSYLPDVAVVEAIFGAAQRFFGVQE